MASQYPTKWMCHKSFVLTDGHLDNVQVPIFVSFTEIHMPQNSSTWYIHRYTSINEIYEHFHLLAKNSHPLQLSLYTLYLCVRACARVCVTNSGYFIYIYIESFSSDWLLSLNIFSGFFHVVVVYLRRVPGIVSLLLSCRSQGLNSGLHAWW